MAKENSNPIEAYIGKIDTIHDGSRNSTTYRGGIYMRSNFGLEGDELLHSLLALNVAKCRPPLDDEEVEQIAASVDRSNTPLGQRANLESVDPDLSPRSIDEILSQEISLFASVTGTTPIDTLTVRQFLDDVKSGKYQELCGEVQAESDKERRSLLKKQLPCVTIQSVPCKRRKREFCKSNAIVCLDLDDVGNDLNGARRSMAELPYVFAVGVSASGRGLFVLVALAEPVEDLKPILKAIQADFKFEVDKACSDVSRLRLVSYDPELILKDTVIPFRIRRKAVPPKIGIDVLDAFVKRVTEVQFPKPLDGKIKNRDYYITSIEYLFRIAKEYSWDIGIRNETPHIFTGEFWQHVELRTFRYFLQAVGIRQGIPHKIIKDHKFVDLLMKQFASEARFPVLSANDTPKINLRNGTLHFTPSGVELKPFDKLDGLNYQLPYPFDPSATAPHCSKFLDHVLPNSAEQKLIFQYVGYVFLPGLNLEKILFLIGDGSNGKSVLLNIIRALVGAEQCCSFSLEEITKSDYHRAVLGNYILNVSTENSARMATEFFKKIASREPLQARHPYGRPFHVSEYATSIFAMNARPRDVEPTGAFFRRFLIVPFDVLIPENEQDPDLAKKIIDEEMSGVLNYVVEGVRTLLAEGDFDIPKSVQDVVEDFRRESDSIFNFIHKGYQPSKIESIPLKEMHDLYKIQYPDGVGKKVFSARLRDLKYEVKRAGRDNTISVYVTRREASAGEVETDARSDDDDLEKLAQLVLGAVSGCDSPLSVTMGVS